MQPSTSTPFPRDIVPELLDAERMIAEHLEKYFSSDPAVGFSGRFFEQMIERSDPCEFTPWDVVAVSTLSVEIPPRAAAAVLLPGLIRDRANDLLAAMPGRSATLETAGDDDIAEGSPAERLYRLLRELPGMGRTKTSKLLAAKRPRLIPIRDSVVEGLLQAGKSWWSPMRELACDERLRALIDRSSMGRVPDNVSYLRRLDVALWSYGTHRGRAL